LKYARWQTICHQINSGSALRKKLIGRRVGLRENVYSTYDKMRRAALVFMVERRKSLA